MAAGAGQALALGHYQVYEDLHAGSERAGAARDASPHASPLWALSRGRAGRDRTAAVLGAVCSAGQRSPTCRLSLGRCWPAGPCHRTGRCSSGREVAGSVLGTQAILRCRMCEGLGCDRVFFPSYVKQQHRPRGDCNLAIVQNLEIKLLFVKREKKSIQPCGGGKMALVKGRHPLWKGRARAQKASCV